MSGGNYLQAERMVRGGHTSEDAAAVVYAVLALADSVAALREPCRCCSPIGYTVPVRDAVVTGERL